jgi:predicted enzyme related to lactoylglutathione lyase
MTAVALLVSRERSALDDLTRENLRAHSRRELETDRQLAKMRRESMITGVHAIIFTKSPDAVRAFVRDVLEFPSVNARDGWLIFALPAAELAAHPADDAGHHELYLMCDDIHATVAELQRRGVGFSRPIRDERWGLITAIKMPDGGELCLYEPRHPTPSHPA